MWFIIFSEFHLTFLGYVKSVLAIWVSVSEPHIHLLIDLIRGTAEFGLVPIILSIPSIS